MMREKFIELLDKAFLKSDDNFGTPNVNQVADFLLANGIIVLPYKIGDTVWEINSENPFEDELKVMETRVEDLFVGTSLDLHHIDSNFLFSNKEDADKALAKMRCEFDNKHHPFKGTHEPYLLVDSDGGIVINERYRRYENHDR